MAAFRLCPSTGLPVRPPAFPAAATFAAPSNIRRCSYGLLARKNRMPFLHSPFSPLSRAAATPSAASAPSPSEFDLSPPPIDHEEDPLERVKTTDDLGISAAFNAVGVADLSHFGRIRVTGADRIQFLHNQTTAKFDSLSEGEGCDTVFVTPTARTIDIAHAWIMKNAIMLLVSPGTCTSICEMLQKYIFYADKVEVNDITEQTRFFVLVGPKSDQIMTALKLDDLIGQSYGVHRHYTVNGMPVTIGVGSVLSRDGFSFLLSPSSSETVWELLLSLGAIPLDADTWERLRVLRVTETFNTEQQCRIAQVKIQMKGRPAPGKELTGDFNVLEAGLQEAVSLDKGCYKGQETISRLITYGGVKQKLWGIQLSGPAQPGSTITVLEDGKKIGVLTSYSVGREHGEHFGLGYVRRRVGLGGRVRIGDVEGILVDVPFLSPSTFSTR